MDRRPLARRAGAPAALVAILFVGACDDGGNGSGDAGQDRSGCPVPRAEVADALGYEVVVDEATASPSSCRYEPGGDVEGHAGAHVLVAERELASGDDDEEGYDAVLASIESEVGTVVALDDDEVDGADRGWVATLGRVVQVGAAEGDRLVQVTVADGALDADAAREAALHLAEATL